MKKFKFPKFPAQLKSRKFWLALLSAFVAFGNVYFDWGLSVDELWTILFPLLAYIGVEGAADIVGRGK